ASHRGTAVAVAVTVAAAFFARAPLEQLLRGRDRRWDRLALGLLSLMVVAGATLAGGWHAALALLVAGGIVASSAIARRVLARRSLGFEIAGMAAMGATAGQIALASGAPWRSAALLGGILETALLAVVIVLLRLTVA